MDDKIYDETITKREITIIDDLDYNIKFIIDEKKLSLTVIADYDNCYCHSWSNIGNDTFTDFLLRVSPYYLGSKLFSRADYKFNLSKSKKRAKELLVPMFIEKYSKKERGEVLKEINAFDIENEYAWFEFITNVDCVDHSRIEYDSYPIEKDLKQHCKRILDAFEKKFKPYLKETTNG